MPESETILYIDPFSGVSGDMLLGALISVGAPLDVIAAAVGKVIPGEVRISAKPVTRSGLAGTKCDVEVVGGPGKRTLAEMLAVVRGAGLEKGVEKGSLETLEALGEAEARAHGVSRGSVHLHELGGQDTLADIVGVQAAIHRLGVDRVHCASLNLGSGTVETAHGTMPVPAPATAFLLEGLPVHASGPEGELTTPTGAALVRGLSDGFGPMPPMALRRVGVGAGTADHEGYPNILRVFIGERLLREEDGRAVLIECGVDDVSPEYLAPAIEAIQGAGAKEVHVIPVQAKKGRLGVLIRVLAGPGDRGAMAEAVLEATGSSGLRFWEVGRMVLPRETVAVDTPHGPVAIKRWKTPSGHWRFKPEFEQVRELAQRAGIPAMRMRDLAIAAYLKERDDGPEED